MNNYTTSRFSPMVEGVLLDAGWFPGRRVEAQLQKWSKRLLEDGFELFPAAISVLLEFGGLTIVQSGAGEECSRESINLDPLAGECEANYFASYAKLLGEKLFPIGEHAEGFAFLAVGESGKIYALTGGVWLVGSGIEDALEHLVRGLKTSPLDYNGKNL